MLNFTYYVPTKIYFGKGQIANLVPALREAGARKVLMVYGGGSIKRSGLYDTITNMLAAHGISWVELGGIPPNPRIEGVREGVRLCHEHGIDLILAVGGGSSIDAAKVIAAAACYDGDAWDIVKEPSKITAALPLVTILTLAATGSEMNSIAVITNEVTNDKIGTRHDLMRPKASIMDPEYTYSVSKYQTASGVADIMAHIFENYFSRHSGGYLQDRMAEALLKTCIKYGALAYNEPNNYEARANLLWAGSFAINGTLSMGKADPWSCHPIDHQLGARYDIAHGVGLAMIYPHWMEYVLSESTLNKFYEFGVNVWGINPDLDKMSVAKAAIEELKLFFKSIALPLKLSEVNIDGELFEEMAEKIAVPVLQNAYVPLAKEDILKIFISMR